MNHGTNRALLCEYHFVFCFVVLPASRCSQRFECAVLCCWINKIDRVVYSSMVELNSIDSTIKLSINKEITVVPGSIEF